MDFKFATQGPPGQAGNHLGISRLARCHFDCVGLLSLSRVLFVWSWSHIMVPMVPFSGTVPVTGLCCLWLVCTCSLESTNMAPFASRHLPLVPLVVGLNLFKGQFMGQSYDDWMILLVPSWWCFSFSLLLRKFVFFHWLNSLNTVAKCIPYHQTVTLKWNCLLCWVSWCHTLACLLIDKLQTLKRLSVLAEIC